MVEFFKNVNKKYKQNSSTLGMHKNRVKNNIKIFEIPALLSSQQGNPEREIFWIIYILGFSTYPDIANNILYNISNYFKI